MVKEGDKFKDGKTGRIYRVKAVRYSTTILEVEDGLDQVMLNQPVVKTIVRGGHMMAATLASLFRLFEFHHASY